MVWSLASSSCREITRSNVIDTIDGCKNWSSCYPPCWMNSPDLLPWPWWEAAQWADAASQVELRGCLSQSLLMAKGSLEKQACNQGKGAMEKCVSSQQRVLPTAKASLAVVSFVSYTVFLSMGLGRYRRKAERRLQCSGMGKWQGLAVHAELESKGDGNTGAFSVPDRSPMQEN